MVVRLPVVILLAALVSASPPAVAASALAVGVTDDPADGIAFGYSYNYPTQGDATASALESCRSYSQAPKANQQCRIIGSLDKGCLAVAFDPKSDSPGMGWAVTETREEAERRAMDDCRNAAPAERRDFCRIDIVKCDGDATEPKE